jgi:hypothetical protein
VQMLHLVRIRSELQIGCVEIGTSDAQFVDDNASYCVLPDRFSFIAQFSLIGVGKSRSIQTSPYELLGDLSTAI